MAQYKVKYNQNIYDVAIQLYGSIEGVFDLLITNPGLTMDTDLSAGQILQYHDYFVINKSIKSSIDNNNYIVANGESAVYYADLGKPFMVITNVYPANNIILGVSGTGELNIDWGDASKNQTIKLNNSIQQIEHYFNIYDTDRFSSIILNGNCSLSNLHIKNNVGEICPLLPFVVDEYKVINSTTSLNELGFISPTSKVDFSKSKLNDLKGIYDLLDLTEIKLIDTVFQNNNALELWLDHIINNYQDRKSALVYLSGPQPYSVMEKIYLIMNTPSWNSPSEWDFFINGVSSKRFMVGYSILGKNIL